MLPLPVCVRHCLSHRVGQERQGGVGQKSITLRGEPQFVDAEIFNICGIRPPLRIPVQSMARNLSPERATLACAPPTAPSGAGLEALKLRSSCDACGTAKVKCDRAHPVCSRCIALGLSCVYGPSRKFGKPPRKRPGATLDAATEKRICTSRISQSRPHHTPTGLDELPSINEATQASLLRSGTDVLPLPPGIHATLSTANEHDPLASCFFPILPLEQWLQLDGLEGGFDIPSASAENPVGTAETSSGNRESHSCPRESYEIFRDLICPSDSLHAPDSNSVTVSAQLDLVLHMNRSAIDRLCQILKCPCAKTGHRAMVHASIVSRILIWYQQAAGWTGSSSGGPRPATLADSSATASRGASQGVSPSISPPPPPPPSGSAAEPSTTNPPASLVQATGFAVEHVPIFMGTFNIEDQNVQAALRNQLVLSELKKAAAVIDMFVLPESADSSTSGVAGLYSYLGAWLRSEHARTVKLLRSRLSELNENLAS